MYNKTVFDWLTETKDDIVNMSRSRLFEIGASVVFLLLITQGRKTWLNFMSIVMFVEGLQHTLFPKTLGIWITGEMDDTHIMLARCLGLLCLTWSFGHFLLSKSLDPTTETSILLAWSVNMLTTMLAKGYLLTHSPSKKALVKIEHEQMVSISYVTMLCTVATLFHLIKSNDWGGYGEQPSHANFHLRLDFVLLLVFGIVSYAVPQWTLKMTSNVDKADSVHAFLMRSIAGLMLTMAMMSNRAANFLRPNDKDAVVFSHWLFYVSSSVLGWIDSAGRWSDLTWGRIALQGVCDLVFILNATGALNRDFSVVKKVVVPRFKAVPRDVRNFFKFKQL